MIENTDSFKIFIDEDTFIKKEELNKTSEILTTTFKQFTANPTVEIKQVKSNEKFFMQISDIFLGGLAFLINNKHLDSQIGEAKKELADYILKNILPLTNFKDLNNIKKGSWEYSAFQYRIFKSCSSKKSPFYNRNTCINSGKPFGCP